MAHDKWTVTASSHSLWDLSVSSREYFHSPIEISVGFVSQELETKKGLCFSSPNKLWQLKNSSLLSMAQIRNKSQICCLIKLWMAKLLVGQVVKYFSCLSVSHCHRFMLVHCVLQAVAMSSWSQSIHTSILPSSPIICPLMRTVESLGMLSDWQGRFLLRKHLIRSVAKNFSQVRKTTFWHWNYKISWWLVNTMLATM